MFRMHSLNTVVVSMFGVDAGIILVLLNVANYFRSQLFNIGSTASTSSFGSASSASSTSSTRSTRNGKIDIHLSLLFSGP
jgi:hypothetical protein